MDLVDIILGVYLALLLHSITVAWLTADGKRSVSDGVRALLAFDAQEDNEREDFDWYVETERRIRERDWAEQQYYQQMHQQEEWSTRSTGGHTAWGEAMQCNPMLPPPGTQYTPPPMVQAPQSTQLPSVPPVPGVLQNTTPVPTTGMPTSTAPMLQPLDLPPDATDGYEALFTAPKM
jgi:hypothetical protein